MSANAVKPGQELDWARAKKLAAEQGHDEDWPYIMAIFTKLVGGSLEKAGAHKYLSRTRGRGGKWIYTYPDTSSPRPTKAHAAQLSLLDRLKPEPVKPKLSQTVETLVDARACQEAWVDASMMLTSLEHDLDKWRESMWSDKRFNRKKLVQELDVIRDKWLGTEPSTTVVDIAGLQVETVDSSIRQHVFEFLEGELAWRRRWLTDKSGSKYDIPSKTIRDEMASSLNWEMRDGAKFFRGMGVVIKAVEPQSKYSAEQEAERHAKWEEEWRKMAEVQLQDVALLPQAHQEALRASGTVVRCITHPNVSPESSWKAGEAGISERTKKPLINIFPDTVFGVLGKEEQHITLTHEVGHVIEGILSKPGAKLSAEFAKTVKEHTSTYGKDVTDYGERHAGWRARPEEWFAEAYRYAFRDGSEMSTSLKSSEFDVQEFRNWINKLFSKLETPHNLEKSRSPKLLLKAGPYIGPRGGKWADPKHTIPWKEPAAPTLSVKQSKDPVDQLIEMGDYLYSLDAVEERNNAGFNQLDYVMWISTKKIKDVIKLRESLKKYKRQLIAHFGEEAFQAAGLEDARAGKTSVGTVSWLYHDTYGSLDIHVDARMPRDLFWEIKGIHEKEFGFRTRKRDYGFVYALDNPEDFDFEAYQARIQEAMGKRSLDFPEAPPKPAKTAEEHREEVGQRIKATSSPVDAVFEGLANRSINNVVGMRYHPDKGTYEFRFPRGKISTMFSNRKGTLPTVTRWDTTTQPWSVHVFDHSSAKLAIDTIKQLEPNFTVVTEGMDVAEKAIQEKEVLDRTPIPAIADKMAPGMAMFPYQNEGVRFIEKTGGRCLLGDEMGLGKTLQCLAWAVKNDAKVVAVVPNNVKRNWIREADKFFPGHIQGRELDSSILLKERRKLEKEAKGRTFGVHEGKDDWIDKQLVRRLGLDKANLATINYESVGKFASVLQSAGFDTIVMDESHRIKNPKAKVTKAISAISEGMKHRILMSGTAVMNKREEFLTQIDLIRPGLFKDKQAIKSKTIGDMWDQMREFYLARRKADVLPDLPEKTTSIVESESAETVPDLVTDQKSYFKHIYFTALSEQLDEGVPLATAKSIAEQYLTEFTEAFLSQDSESQKMEIAQAKNKAIGEFQRLLHAVAVAKVPQTVDFVQNTLSGSTSNMIVFTESKAAAKEIHQELGDVAVLHTGDQNDEQKDQARGHFEPGRRDPESPKRVIVATRKSMAEGVTLTEADKVVFNDLPWTGAAVGQAESRVHRPGQDKPVNVYWMQAKDNQMDQLVASIVQRKIKLHVAVNQGRKLSEKDEEWMNASVSVKDMLAELEGKTAGPSEPVALEVETPKGKVDVQIDPREPKAPVKRTPIIKPPIERTPIGEKKLVIRAGPRLHDTPPPSDPIDLEVKAPKGKEKPPRSVRAAAKEEATRRREALPKLVMPKPKPKLAMKVPKKRKKRSMKVDPRQLKLFKAYGQTISNARIRDIALARMVAMPEPSKPLDIIDKPSGHFFTPESVISDLGLSSQAEKRWTRIVTEAAKLDERVFRQTLIDVALDEGMDPIRRRALLGRAIKFYGNTRPTGRKLQVFYPAELTKAVPREARGGSYARRVPRKGGKGYTYYYDEDQYHRRGDAHITGEGATRKRVEKAVSAALEGSGGKGLSLQSLRELAKKHGRREVGVYLNKAKADGVVTYKSGRIRRKGKTSK